MQEDRKSKYSSYWIKKQYFHYILLSKIAIYRKYERWLALYTACTNVLPGTVKNFCIHEELGNKAW